MLHPRLWPQILSHRCKIWHTATDHLFKHFYRISFNSTKCLLQKMRRKICLAWSPDYDLKSLFPDFVFFFFTQNLACTLYLHHSDHMPIFVPDSLVVVVPVMFATFCEGMLFSLTNLPSPFCFFCSHRHPKTSVDHRRGEWPSDLCSPSQKVFRHSRSAKGGSDLIHEPPLRPFSQHQTSCLRGTFVRISFARGRLFVLASVKAGRCSSQSPVWGCNPNLGVIDGCHCLHDFPVSMKGHVQSWHM